MTTTTTNEYRSDNTTGYTTAELVELNARFLARLAEAGVAGDDDSSSAADARSAISERVLADWDREIVAEATAYCGGCGCDVISAEAAYHGGVPYCDVCEAAPVEADY